MSAAYADRFAVSVAGELGERFTVTNSQGLIVATHADGGCMVLHAMTPRDKRAPVRPLDVARWIEYAAVRVRRALPHYTPEAATAARALLEDVSR